MLFRFLLVYLVFGLLGCKTAAKLLDKTELKSGDTFTYRLHRDTDLEMDLNGRRQISTNKQTFDLGYEVLEILPDGSVKYELTYKTIKIWQVNGFRTLQFDSEKEEEQKNLEFNQQVFQKMLGKKLELTLSNNGEVLHFKGADSIIDEFFKDIRNSDLLGFYRAVREQVGDLPMIELLKQLHNIYPLKTPISGEVWETETSQMTGIGTQKISTFLLKKSAPDDIVFSMKAAIKPNPEAREIKMGDNRVKFSLKGEETGNYNLESLSGKVTNASLTTHLSGTATITGLNNLPLPAIVTVRMETNFKLL